MTWSKVFCFALRLTFAQCLCYNPNALNVVTRHKDKSMTVDNQDIEMNALKVYLESSFISYLTERPTTDAKVAADQAYTRQWWRDECPKCKVFASRFVVDESDDGNDEHVASNKEMTPVEEVRAVRHRIAEECGHDIRKIMEHAANAMRTMKLVATPAVV